MIEGAYDFVIVGGGTAGCVVAARLSENPALRVALIEAGPDLLEGEETREIKDLFPASYADPRTTWPDLIAEVGSDPGDGGPVYTRRFNQGRILGGSSSINGMLAQRGLPSDFNEWERLGAVGWNWEGVLPYFNKLEHDWDSRGPLHGDSGPIDIRRCPREDAPPYAAAMADAMEEAGYPFHRDMNGFFDDCVTMVSLNNTPKGRVSTATAYINAEVRNRPNFTLLTDMPANRLLVENRVVKGIEATRDGKPVRIEARETIVCAGALHSPLLLLRSGIGPAEQLRNAGVPIAADVQGVGQSLFNHPGLFLAVHLPSASKQRADQDSWASTLLRYSSNHPGCPAGDMQIFPVNRSAWYPLGWRIGAVGMYLYKPFSKGSIELSPAGAAASPVIKFKLLSDKRDFDRLVDCLAKTAKFLKVLQKRGVIHEAFVPPGGQANALNSPNFKNFVKATIIKWVFDIPFGLRRYLLRRNIVDLDILATDKAACARIIRETAAGVHHVSGTCRMGSLNDPDTVVDPRCRVRGVTGLRVVDASIMPSIVSANTHIPVVMLGERAADLIAEDHAGAIAHDDSFTPDRQTAR